MQGGGKRFNQFHQEARNPGVNVAVSDWPPDMSWRRNQGDADLNIHGRNQQYVEDILPDVRRRHLGRRKLSRGDLTKPAGVSW